MKPTFTLAAAVATLVLSLGAGTASAQNVGPTETLGPNGQISQSLALTHQQKSAILKAVSGDETKIAHVPIPEAIGAQVPPSINLHALPDEAVDNNAAAKLYQFTVVNGNVIIVDPTKMQVVEVIRKLAH